LNALLIAPDRELAEQFLHVAAATRTFQIVADLKKYPPAQTLEIRLRQFQPEVVLVDVGTDLETACGLVSFICALPSPPPVVALDRSGPPETVLRLLRLGAREYLALPFEAGVVQAAAAGIARQLGSQNRKPEEPATVVAFSSAKPGSGASTLASQTAFALRRITRQPVLLADLDLLDGAAGFYAGCRSGGSFLDLLERASWPGKFGEGFFGAGPDGLEVAPAPESPAELPLDPVQFRQAMDQLRAAYAWIVLDLPVIFHRASLMAMAEADRAFLVVTLDLAALHLARKALRLIERLEGGRKPEVLVNMAGRGDGLIRPELDKILGVKVFEQMPDDAPGVRRAAALGQPLSGTPLGQAIDGLAGQLAGVERSATAGQAGLLLKIGPALAGT